MANGQSPFSGTEGDPVVLYHKPSTTWVTVWLDTLCGAQGLGGYKSTTPWIPNSWTHFCVFSEASADRESGFADNNPASPFFGRMYIFLERLRRRRRCRWTIRASKTGYVEQQFGQRSAFLGQSNHTGRRPAFSSRTSG